MERTVTLKTEGYEITFTLQQVEATPSEDSRYSSVLRSEDGRLAFWLKEKQDVAKFVRATVGFSLTPTLGKVHVTSKPSPIQVQDLERLTTYLEEHIAHLQRDHWSTSEVFVTIGLQFQLQALAGEVDSPDDGEFALRFMVNVGVPDADSGHVYVGGEATVELAQVKQFIAGMRQALRDLSS